MRHKGLARGRARSRAALRLVLLALPVLFWSAVFMVVAGVGPMQRVVDAVPDSVQAAFALACPLLAVVLGTAAIRQEGRGGGFGGGAALCRLTIGAGLALFVFAVLASLKPL